MNSNGPITIMVEDVPRDCRAILRRTLWIKTELTAPPDSTFVDSYPIYTALPAPVDVSIGKEASEPVGYLAVEPEYLEDLMQDTDNEPDATEFIDLLEEEAGYLGILFTGVSVSRGGANSHYLQAFEWMEVENIPAQEVHTLLKALQTWNGDRSE